jgi:Divergent InlB B-repeat domain
MRARIGAVGVLVAALTLAFPASGSAVTTIGSNLADPFFNTLNCSGFPTGCTASFGLTMPVGSSPPAGFRAPSDGVVVRWRVKSPATPALTSLQILRPGASTTRAAVVTSEARMPDPSTTTVFDTRLLIKSGDTIGVKSQFPPYASVAGAEFRYSAPALVDGGAAAASTAFANSVLLVNADIEFDGDHDGYGDETQDLCPFEATEHDGCVLTVDVGPNGKVTGPGINCPGDCTEAYPQDTAVHLTAVPDPGFATTNFQTPIGGCSFPPSTCDFTMASNRTASATFGDNQKPDTTITKGPKKKSSKRKVKIKFESNESPPRFQCALDKGDHFVGFCDSPFKARVDPGKHKFLVRAVDAGDLVDTSPAKLKFKVLD